MGTPGPIGDPGRRGFSGPQGPKGFKGDRGPLGYTGERGEQGYRGEPGERGYIGRPGKPLFKVISYNCAKKLDITNSAKLNLNLLFSHLLQV